MLINIKTKKSFRSKFLDHIILMLKEEELKICINNCLFFHVFKLGELYNSQTLLVPRVNAQFFISLVVEIIFYSG